MLDRVRKCLRDVGKVYKINHSSLFTCGPCAPAIAIKLHLNVKRTRRSRAILIALSLSLSLYLHMTKADSPRQTEF
jgi:hypothetical protein